MSNVFKNAHRNVLTLEMVKLARHLVLFGFYSLENLLVLVQRLLRILENDFHRDVTPQHVTRPASRNAHDDAFDSHTARSIHADWVGDLQQDDLVILDSKLYIIQIIEFLFDVRLDYRMSHLLTVFKRLKLSASAVQGPVGSSNASSKRADAATRNFIQRTFAVFQKQTGNDPADACAFIDIDGDNNRMITRVLLALSLEKHPKLVSGALQLLIRNFSQRKELMTAFAQVQLMVSEKDVRVFNIVRINLGKLRVLIEKSELWVYRPEHESDAKVDDQRNFNVISELLDLLANICSGSMRDELAHNQRLLKNFEAHQHVLSLFHIPCDRKSDMVRRMEACAYRFLTEFCRNNRENQGLLHKHLPFFIDHLGSCDESIDCVTQMFFNNEELCRNASLKTIQKILAVIEVKGRKVSLLRLLKTLIKTDDAVHPQIQNSIMDSFTAVTDSVLLLYKDDVAFASLVDMMQDEENLKVADSDLLYHIELVSLLAMCTIGMNVYTEIKCQVCILH
jgi:hypothetical protein